MANTTQQKAHPMTRQDFEAIAHRAELPDNDLNWSDTEREKFVEAVHKERTRRLVNKLKGQLEQEKP